MTVQISKDLAILDIEMLNTLRSLDNFRGLFLNELIEIFEQDSALVSQRLIHAIESNTAPEAMRIAHKLKGMGSNLGTQRMSALLEKIEVDFESFDQATRDALPELIRVEHASALRALRASWWVIPKAV